MTSGLPYQQGLAAAVQLLRGRWHLPVMAALVPNQLRFGDLLAEVNRYLPAGAGPDLSPKVANDTLRQMVETGLVAKTGSGDRFTAVWYSLTDRGRSLLEAIRPLADWAERYPEDRP